MTTESGRLKIKTFISRFSQNHELQDSEDIFATGFVNSLFAMQLILFLEKEFGIAIESEDLDFENFRTINAMVDLVERKTALLNAV